jgi:hypothetical protein
MDNKRFLRKKLLLSSFFPKNETRTDFIKYGAPGKQIRKQCVPLNKA